MYLVAPAILVGLGLGLWLKTWRVVIILLVVGLVVSIIGWAAGWFADEDTPALGGALIFEVIVCLPVAIGAWAGVYVARSRARARPEDGSSLPIIGPPPDRP